MRNSVRRGLISVLFVAGIGCGTVRVQVPVMRPAEVNMSAYHSVGIGGMSGQGHEVMATALEEALVKSDRFQVVDREHLASVMRELQMSASDLADPNKASKLGKQITANALIFGTIEERYKEQRGDSAFVDNNKVTHRIHKLHGEVVMSATFKVTDVTTGTLITAKTIEERRNDDHTGIDSAPAPIDRDALSRDARHAVLHKFIASIVPHKEFLDAAFFTDGDLPQLETGVGYAQRGDWKKAQEMFNSTIADAERNPKIKTQVLGKAYWDLALAYEYNGDYDKALTTVDKAYQLTQDGDMLAEQDNIKRLQGDSKKLSEQTAKPEGSEGASDKP